MQYLPDDSAVFFATNDQDINNHLYFVLDETYIIRSVEIHSFVHFSNCSF